MNKLNETRHARTGEVRLISLGTSRPSRTPSRNQQSDGPILRRGLLAFGVALRALGLLLLAFPVSSEVVTNQYVNPCINIFVPDPRTGQNACVTSAAPQVDVGDVYIGEGAPGTLSISSGTTLLSHGFVNIGSSARGDVSVSGAGATLTVDGALTNLHPEIDVGNAAVGTLSVSNGGRASARNVFVGVFGSAGSVTIGTGGNLSAGSNLIIGAPGEVSVSGGVISSSFLSVGGSLSLSNGGRGTAGTLGISNGVVTVASGSTLSAGFSGGGGIDVGSQQGSSGDVAVVGSGSQATVAGVFRVGSVGTGTLTIANGAQVNAPSLISLMSVGSQTTGNGTVVVDGGQLNLTQASGPLIIGDAGVGTLSVKAGGQVNGGVGLTMIIGSQKTGRGSVTIDSGQISLLSMPLIVGDAGTGTLMMQPGSQVKANNVILGNQASGIGNVVVGNGSSLTSTFSLTVGKQSASTSSLKVNSGGTVTVNSGDLFIGSGQATNGAVTVDGGTLTATGKTRVGDAGTGTLTVTNGGQVRTADFIVGNQASGLGTVLVDNGSSLIFGTMTVGNRGTGTSSLTVRSDSSVATESGGILFIGAGQASNGATIVDGGRLRVNSITVGDAGNGALTIQSGGQVNTFSVTLGNQATGVGTVVVDSGASFSFQGMTVGNQGIDTSTLTVKSGGSLTSSGTFFDIGSAQGSSGIVTIDGGQLTGTSQIRVGVAGTGTLTIQNSQVSASAVTLGNQATGVGTVVIENGSALTVTSAFTAFTVGNQSTSTSNLRITSGSTVALTSGNAIFFVGLFAGEGVVTVDGSQLNLSGQNSLITVGGFGTGTLNIQNNGQVNTASMTVGRNAAGLGTVVVDGSSLILSSSLTVGNQSSGTSSLTVRSGGIVTVNDQVVIGSLRQSNGAVTVDGGQLTAAGQLIVGDVGNGGLTIRNGGIVTANSVTLGKQQTGTGTVVISEDSTLVAHDLTIAHGSLTIDGTVTLATPLNNMGLVIGAGRVEGGLNNAHGGLVSPGGSESSRGDIGTLTITKDYLQLAGAATVIDIAGESQFDTLRIDGEAHLLDGKIDINFLNGFLPYVGEKFALVKANSLDSGVWSSIPGAALPREMINVVGLPEGLTYCDDFVNGALTITIEDFAGIVLGGIGIDAQPGATVMDAHFTPRCGIDLKTAAQLGQYDHFNWSQLIEFDPVLIQCSLSPAKGQCLDLTDISGKNPKLPAVDAPPGGWYYQTVDSCKPGAFPISDFFPWYLDEVYGAVDSLCVPGTVARVIATPPFETVLDAFTDKVLNTLNYTDRPSSADLVEFLTCLAGVQDDGTGSSLQGLNNVTRTKPEEKACFRWSYSGSVDDIEWARDALGPPGHGEVDFLGFVSASDLPADELALLESLGGGMTPSEPPGAPGTVPEPDSLMLLMAALLAMSAVHKCDPRRRDIRRDRSTRL